MPKILRPVRKLLTGGVLLTASEVFIFRECLSQLELRSFERQATIREMLRN